MHAVSRRHKKCLDFWSRVFEKTSQTACIPVRADADNRRIQKFTSEGVFVSQWSTEGDGLLSGPRNVAVAFDGSVYVSFISDYPIQKFTSAGVFVSQWSTESEAEWEMGRTQGVAVASDGSVYVADAINHRIQKFTAEGAFVSQWGTEGEGDGQFNRPDGIEVASDDNVYVADTGNHRIQKFLPVP